MAKIKTSTKKETNNNFKNYDFIKQLVKYYMDFLETDFHRRKTPRRNIKFKDKNNLSVGIKLRKYEMFNAQIQKIVIKGFDIDSPLEIRKGVYKNNTMGGILDSLIREANKIDVNKINILADAIFEDFGKVFDKNEMESDENIEKLLNLVRNKIKIEIVSPFVNIYEQYLKSKGEANDIFIVEDELVSNIMNAVENGISEIAKSIKVREKNDIRFKFIEIFNASELKYIVSSYFENYDIVDLFNELYEIQRNKSILDKQELYFYFYDIAFNNIKYPIFYIPINIEVKDSSVLLEFDSQVFINKKALDYISQEWREITVKKGNLQRISERIIYLAEKRESLGLVINDVLTEITNFFELNVNLEISSSIYQISKSDIIQVTNSCYFSLFDKSDEALVNDYEMILKLIEEKNDEIGMSFNILIDEFFHKEPVSFNNIVEDEWEKTTIEDRLVYKSPIPLNSEQRQILSAIHKEKCKYIVVEGPPGTGKSHTITAIAFDAILNNQSILILSDKKEALDVVEDKITSTMNNVRIDKNFQNPILRLGKTGNTYRQILASSTIESIKDHHRVTRNHFDKINKNILKSVESLKENLLIETLSYEGIELQDIIEFTMLEKLYEKKELPIVIEEFIGQETAVDDLEEFRKIILNIKAVFDEQYFDDIFSILNLNKLSFVKIEDFKSALKSIQEFISVRNKIQVKFGVHVKELALIENFEESDIEILKKFVERYEKEKNWLFGYLFKRNKIANINNEFIKTFDVKNTFIIQNKIIQIKTIISIYEHARKLIKNTVCHETLKGNYINFINHAISDSRFIEKSTELAKVNDEIDYFELILKKYPKFSEDVSIGSNSFLTIFKNNLFNMTEEEFSSLVHYIDLKQRISRSFEGIPMHNYLEQKGEIESLATTIMTYLMDGRLITFNENYKNTAKTLSKIIASKQKFPREDFKKLREAFPCILAGIRDFSDYIPLEPDIFDILIIDEASQVSVAQAFPALLRAKRVIILGDKKQFSNIKTALARTDTNKEYMNNLRDRFLLNISNENSELLKLEHFDIKTSILEFIEYIANYQVQLRKHFRGYKELISYSDKTFYKNTLQVMKIRGKNINEVIQFSYVSIDDKIEIVQNTNSVEVQFIIEELLKMKEQNIVQSVGIITPHTNQQKMIIEKISRLPEYDYIRKQLNLKVMTFDTCQGEERDIIFYSMVATERDDHLWGVFIKNLSDMDVEEEGKIKVQRLNVGFSRAKEKIHFVLSKPNEKYNGSIGDAIRHYENVLKEAKKEHNVDEVDRNSLMEQNVMNWFYQSKFWKEKKNLIEFIPQFELGKYLKQFDQSYCHPNYRVDFLLIYKKNDAKTYKIIIEYDGFKEHFTDLNNVNKYNYQNYYSSEDVYRQKILEGYGYQFIRINRFNTGNNPVATLNERIENIVDNVPPNGGILGKIKKTIDGVHNGNMKQCPKCKEFRCANDFKDPSLKNGLGKICNHCKSANSHERVKKTNENSRVYTNVKKCPLCGSMMVLRKGRYGKFYGCLKYPYCRGTRKYKK